MGEKYIAVNEDVYERLKGDMRKDESYSDLLRRMFKGEDYEPDFDRELRKYCEDLGQRLTKDAAKTQR